MVDTSTQHYLELEFALAETTQTANKSPKQITEDTELPPPVYVCTYIHTQHRGRGEPLWCAY